MRYLHQHTYGTAQLQGNIHTHLEHVQDVSRMCVRCVWNVCETHPEHARKTCPEHAQDRFVQVQNFAIKLRLDLHNFHALFGQIQDTSRMRVRCVQDMSGMRANVTLELSCTVCNNS